MLKLWLSSWILLSYDLHALATFARRAEPTCVRKGQVESTFGKEIYDDWSIWNVVHIVQPAPVMTGLLRKAEGLGANRVVITGGLPLYLETRSRTHGSYASTKTTSFSAVTVQAVAYACP